MSEKQEEYFFLPELLRLIFEVLDTKSRLECKLVCEEWYEILGQDMLFKKDRTVVLESRYLHEQHPAVLALSDSATKFEKLVIRDLKYDLTANIDEFWQNLGYTVTEIVIGGSNERNLKDKLCFFQVLKKIKTSNFDFLLESDEDKVGLDSSLESIETLSCTEYSLSYDPIALKKLIASMPNLVHIRFSSVHHRLPNNQNVPDDILANVGNNFKSLPYDRYFAPLVRAATNLKHISCIDPVDPATFGQDIEQLGTLQSYSIRCTNKLPFARVNLIRRLYYTMERGSNDSLQSLDRFTNLQYLFLEVSRSVGCFFGHQVIKSHVKHVFLDIEDSFFCLNCFSTMLESFSRLKKLYLYIEFVDEHLTILAKHQHRLKTVVLERPERNLMEGPCLKHTQLVFSIVNLTELSILLEEQYDLQLFMNGLPKIPNLHKLCLDFSSELAPLKTMKYLSKNLTSTIEYIEIFGAQHNIDVMQYAQQVLLYFAKYNNLKEVTLVVTGQPLKFSRSDLEKLKASKCDNIWQFTMVASSYSRNFFQWFNPSQQKYQPFLQN